MSNIFNIYVTYTLSVLALCIHWFNPVAWLSFILSQKDMEISCDERVLRISDTDAGSSYTEALTGFSAVQDSFLNGGILALSENYLKRRIKNVGGHKKHGYMGSITTVVVFLVLGALLLTNHGGVYRQKAEGGRDPLKGQNLNHRLPMLKPEEWERGYMVGEIKLEGKTDKNGNLNALYFRPAGHMSHLDSFIIPQDIRSFYLANNSIWTGKFSAGETVQVIYPEERKLLDCRILRLTSRIVDKEVGQDRLTVIETNEKGQLVLPKERGNYMFVLRTEKEMKIQTYVGILKID